MRIDALYRYPVKGLSPERLPRVSLEIGGGVPGDRLYAVENGPSGFDPVSAPYPPKIRFLMLMRDETLARLETRYDDAGETLFVRRDGEVFDFPLGTPDGRDGLAEFLSDYVGAGMRGPARVLSAPGHSFSDVPAKVVSIINLASVRTIETVVGAPVDPLRFRGNVYVEGLDAWAEFDLIGKELAGPSGLRLRVVKRTERCAATNVDPATGIRDLQIPRALFKTFGHADCGVYAEVTQPGSLAEGERLTTIGATAPDRPAF